MFALAGSLCPQFTYVSHEGGYHESVGLYGNQINSEDSQEWLFLAGETGN